MENALLFQRPFIEVFFITETAHKKKSDIGYENGTNLRVGEINILQEIVSHVECSSENLLVIVT